MADFDLLAVLDDGSVKRDLACTNCDFAFEPQLQANFMRGTGPAGADFMFVGHAPGDEDDAIGRAFTGANGRQFRTLLKAANIREARCRFSNCLRCAPYGKEPQKRHWKACQANLREEIQRIKPKAIVSLGARAFNWLTGFTGPRKLRRHGFPCLLAPDIYVYPILQPAALFHERDPDAYAKLRAMMVSDLKWLARKALDGTLHVADDTDLDYKTAKTVEDVEAFLAEFDDVDEVSVDMETATPDFRPSLFPHPGHRLVAIGFSYGPGHGRAVPMEARGVLSYDYWKPEELAYLFKRIGGFLRTKRRYGHNYNQFDSKWERAKFGIEWPDVSFDTQYASYILDEEKGLHDLQKVALRYTKMPPWKNMPGLSNTMKLCDYLNQDVDATARVRLELEARLNDKQRWLLFDHLIPVGRELMDMEYRGVKIDEEQLDEFIRQITSLEDDTVKAIRAMEVVQRFEVGENTTFNPNAPHHIAKILEHYLKLSLVGERTKKGHYGTDQHVLEAHFGDDFCKKTLLYKRQNKLRSNYGVGFKKQIVSGVAHTSYNITATVTGRPGSRTPNLNNLPRADRIERVGLTDLSIYKSSFVPSVPEWGIVQFDYSQIELRVLGMLSGDAGIREAYEQDLDLHSATAARAYSVPLDEFLERLAAGDSTIKGYRSAAKIVNFGLIYGKSEASLERDFVEAARIAAQKEGRPFEGPVEPTRNAQQFIAAHKKSYPDVWKWLAKQERIIRTKGFQETPFGRRRHHREFNRRAVRQAYNFPIQSAASDFIFIALARLGPIFRELGFKARPILTVYDSAVYELPLDETFWPTLELAHRVMTSLDEDFDFITVPVKVDIEAGRSWGKLYELSLEKRAIKKPCAGCGGSKEKKKSCVVCGGSGKQWIALAA